MNPEENSWANAKISMEMNKKRHLVFALFLVGLAMLGAGPSYDYRRVLYSDTLPTGGMCSVSIFYPQFKGHSALACTLNAFIDALINGIGEEETTRPHYSDYWDLSFAIVEEWQNIHDYGIGFEEILDICVLLNRDIVTLYVSNYSYAGGAHGWGNITWHMFGPDGTEIDPGRLLRPDAKAQLNHLLIKNFKEQYENTWEHGDDFITAPYTFSLADEGLLVMYEGCCFAEGYPVICIPREEVYVLLRDEIQDLY